MPVPTRRLAVVAVALAVARLLLPNDFSGGLYTLDGALLVVAVADWLLAPAPRRIGVERVAPAVITLGQRGDVTWTLTNSTRRRQPVSIADALAPSLHAETRRASATLPPEGTARIRTTVQPTRRGRFRLDQLVVRVDGPLRLTARQRARALPAVVQVHPPFKSQKEAELRIRKARLLEIGLRSAQGRGGGTEFEQLREYGPDDEIRRVDWAATARAGKAIVRTYRAERNQTVMVLLDNGRLMAARVADVPRLEHAMDAALLLTTVATRLGDKAGLVVFDADVRAVLEPSHARMQPGLVTELLFDLQSELVEPDYRSAFASVVARYRRRVLLVLLTELSEQAAGEFLLPALPLITRSHVVVIGAVRDPEVEAWARAPVVESEDAFRRAAAISALTERQRLTAKLRSLGVTVVDAEPGKLAPELADAYLKLKATGTL